MSFVYFFIVTYVVPIGVDAFVYFVFIFSVGAVVPVDVVRLVPFVSVVVFRFVPAIMVGEVDIFSVSNFIFSGDETVGLIADAVIVSVLTVLNDTIGTGAIGTGDITY